MPFVNGATLLARALAIPDPGPIFTLSGNQVLPVYDAGIDSALRFIDTRHESAAAYMADAWGRLTGRPGICLVTAGPGHTNALTGVATALLAESPVIFLSGGCDVARLGQGGFQELDQISLAAPVCKAAWMARSAAELPELVARAHRTALEGVPGPVHITLPFDVLNEQVDEAAAPLPGRAAFEPRSLAAGQTAITRAVDLLASSRQPLAISGPFAWRGAAGERLRELMRLVGMPAFPVESPRGLTDPSLHGIGSEFPRADLTLLLAPQDFTIGFAGPRVLGQSQIIQVAPTDGELARNRPVDVGLVGDPTTVLGQLVAAVRADARFGSRSREWADSVASTHASNATRFTAEERTDATPVHPLRACVAVRDALETGDCVVLDGGEFGQWARWALGDGPYRQVGNGKLGGIGGGISFAIAAKLAHPERRSVAMVGDGTFGFHAMEIDTAVRFGVPMVVVVGNDAGWAAERHRQRELYGPDRVVASDLLPSRYDLVATALGAHGELVERADELDGALARAFASGKPSVVNVMIDSVASPSSSH
ncbi:MAG: thiamine pyrophosphate-binding protein [Chloroflexota bacterium]